MRKIGLFGGTFDPPHIGHFIIAQEVKNHLTLDEIWFIPTNEPPHKNNAFINKMHRLEMLQRVVDTVDSFRVNPIELNRIGKSYTIDTIKAIKDEFPEDDFYFIIGADMVEYLPKWHEVEKLLSLVQFVGVGRPNYSLTTNYPIKKIDIPLVEISSTEIRKRIKKGWDIKYFLPHEVYIYMKEHLLYEHR